VNLLAPQVQSLSFLRPFSPFRWYFDPDPLLHGLQVENALVLVAIAIVAFGIALVALERRDLSA